MPPTPSWSPLGRTLLSLPLTEIPIVFRANRAPQFVYAQPLWLSAIPLVKLTTGENMSKTVAIAVVVSVLVTLGAIAGLARVPAAKRILGL